MWWRTSNSFFPVNRRAAEQFAARFFFIIFAKASGTCVLPENDRMTKSVTIKDIAAEAGVSIALVSFVMNNRTGPDGKKKYRVSEATRDKILTVAKRLDYQPNPAARTLRKGKSKVIGAVFPDISNVFYGEIAREMEELAFRHGYTVLVGNTDESPEKLDTIVRTFINRGVDGFVVVPCEGSEESIARILHNNIPLVFMDRRNMEVPAPKVVLNNREAMRNAVMLLEEKGARKIEMLSFTMRVSSITEREEGFAGRMRELGFREEDIHIHRIPFHDQMAAVREVMEKVCEGDTDGLVFATNYLTISGIKALSTMGVRIQEDIRIVGFDSSDVYELFHPPIPYVRQPVPAMCRMAMDSVLDIIDGKLPQEHRLISLDSETVTVPSF